MNSPLVAIVGRSKDTVNYENAMRRLAIPYIITLNVTESEHATHLILPGGGDITPAFYGQLNNGSRNIDTELDILQIQAFSSFMTQKKPILGICKGLQLINIQLGGTVTQHIENTAAHMWDGCDKQHYVYHSGVNRTDFFYQLYGTGTNVNSAHHQAVDRLGRGLIPVCRAGDGVMEGIMHTSLPIIAVQWHPERILNEGGELLLTHFIGFTPIS